MFKFFKEKIEQRQEEKEEKEVELSPEDKEKRVELKEKKNLAELGAKAIKRKEYYFAALCFKEAGYPDEAIKPLEELAEISKTKEKQNQEKPVKQIELPPDDKLRVKGMGLRLLAKNQRDAAKTCFEGLRLPDEEIESLLDLSFFGIEEEEKKIKEELEKMRQEEEEK